MHTRTLTIHFQRSITSGVPNVMEVAIAPLNEPGSPVSNTMLVGGTQVKTIVLSNAVNTVTFDLVPTDLPELTSRVTYRAAWRERYLGRQQTQDFVMPDFDVVFDDLEELGSIIGGDTYLQWTNRGVPNGVAALNALGEVVDAAGVPITGAADATLQAGLDDEMLARIQGDQTQNAFTVSHVQTQLNAALTTVSNNLTTAVAALNGDVDAEASLRQQAVDSLNATIAAIQTTANSTLSQLASKADLVAGKIPVGQLPSVMFGKAVGVPNQSAMLALTVNQVNQGDFAVRPDGIFFLNGSNPSVLGNWVQFRDNTAVLSINGQSGAVTLTASSVGARPSATPVPIGEVNGLTAALNAKASSVALGDLDSRVADIETDPTLVHSVGGLVPRSAMPADAAFVNSSNLVTKKDGTVLNLGTGGTLGITDVNGLTAALGGKASTSHSHAMTDITGLNTALSGHDSRIFSLEGRVEVLESLPGGGGSGTSVKTSWWSSASATTDLTQVTLRSPFGWNGTAYYYDPAGAAVGEAVFPYLSPNGHLKFVARNESAPADPALAAQSDLSALTTTVAGKASQSALDALTTTVSGKAAQSALDALTTTVAGKASQSSVTTLTTSLSNKANQTDLDTLTTTVAGKSSASALTALTTTVGTKADQSALTALTTTVSGKASQAALDALTTTVGTKAPQTSLDSLVTRVTAVESGKAALDANGKIYTSQLPNLALTSVTPVASRLEMLALTSTAVQPGDVCLINDTTIDRGSYILTDPNPALLASWTKLITPEAGVVTVNSVMPVSGNITLTASDVGARPAGAVLQSEVTGLTSALAAKLDTSTYTSGIAGKIALADAQALLVAATPLKWRADLVDTVSTSVPSGSGITVDGATVSTGNIVLLTNQSPATNNGLYVAGTGTWTRAGTDMLTGSYFLKGSAVMIQGGSSNTGTIYQQSQAAGVVGTNSNNWTKVFTAGSGATNAFTASAGIQKVTVGSGGSTTYDFRLDTTVAARKWSGYVTPASGNYGIATHNLGTKNVVPAFRDASTDDAFLAGWKPDTTNTILVEFASPIGSTQVWATVIA